MKMKRTLALLLALAMALSLAACGDSNSGDDGSAVYRTLYSAEVETMNYLTTTTANNLEIPANVVDTLIEYDCYGVVQPALAESWEHNDDYTEWTFHIRQGVKWVDKDGNEVAEVTAQDWVDAAHYILDAKNDSGSEYNFEVAQVTNAAAYYEYTAYQLALETATDGTDDNGNPVKLDENGEFVGGISKFLQERKEKVIEALGLKPGDFIGLTAGKKLAAQKTAGVLRRLLGAASEKHMKKDCYEFCWIVDFPMYEIGEESGELEFCHNPFSMPQGGMNALCNEEPLSILAYQYDLVCNGVELSSGAVRNHDPEIMIKAFELVGLGEEDVKAKFPAMYNAFCYGAPPHAGIAPGVDRMIMLICGEESIREIIPFPMNKNAMDIMMGAPATVDQKQLDDVHIRIQMPEEK